MKRIIYGIKIKASTTSDKIRKFTKLMNEDFLKCDIEKLERSRYKGNCDKFPV